MKILCNFYFFLRRLLKCRAHFIFRTNIRAFGGKKKYLHVPHVGHQCGKTVYLKDIWQIKNYNDLGLNVFYQSAIK